MDLSPDLVEFVKNLVRNITESGHFEWSFTFPSRSTGAAAVERIAGRAVQTFAFVAAVIAPFASGAG